MAPLYHQHAPDRYGQWLRQFARFVLSRQFIPLCLAAAFIIRVGWVFAVDAGPVSDFRWYYDRGVDFAVGRGYSVSPDAFWPENIPPPDLLPTAEYPAGGRPTAYWPVGYPAFLGLLFTVFGPSLLVAKIANIFLYAGVLLLSYHLAKRLFNSELVGRSTLLILSFYPDHIAYSSLLASEILFLFLLLLGVTLLLAARQRFWLGLPSGLVFGLACLVKPQAVFIPAIVFAVWFISQIRQGALWKLVSLGVLVHIILGLTLSPWLVRNYIIFNDFVFISNNGGYNLLVGNNPYATGAYVFNDEIVSMLSDASTESDRDGKARQLAVDYLRSHPFETMKLWPAKLWYLYGKDVKGIVWNQRGLAANSGGANDSLFWTLKVIAQLYYMLIGAAFLFFLYFQVRTCKEKTGKPPLPTLGLWIVAYLTVISLLTFGNGRFHFPMMPWIVMYAGALAEGLAGTARPEAAAAGNLGRGIRWA
ncbi:MAG: glycosyltransferase family 39 protein [Anaerolineae bacterium]